MLRLPVENSLYLVHAHPCLKTQEFLKVVAIKLLVAIEPEFAAV
jgi:hypothetical protein